MDKVIINCDWLQYSVLLNEAEPEFLCPDGYRLEVLQGNNIFRNRIIVWDLQGRKWLTLLWSPYSSRLNSHLMTVQVGNELLYGSAINMSFSLLQSIVECSFNSMGRVDVCCDWVISANQLETLKHLNSGHYYVQAKSEGSSWWHKKNEANKNGKYYNTQHHCLTWGSPKSQIKIKIYCKSREQDQLSAEPHPDKPYIVQMWKDVGFDTRNVWRLEFSITKSSKARYDNHRIGLEEISSNTWLTHLFYQLYTSRFIVRQNEGKRTDKTNNDKIIQFLNLPEKESLLRWAVGENERPPVPDAVNVLRSLMNQLNSSVVAVDERLSEYLCSAIATIVQDFRLSSYFENHYGQPYGSYLQQFVNQSGPGIYEVDGHPDKTWN